MLGTTLGAAGGFFLGGPMGMGMGSAIGGAIGNGIGYFTGSGDYKVQNNACAVPSYRSSDSTTITHREYITDILSGTGTPTTFNIQSFSLNPGQPGTYPWLAQIAANYEEYDIQGMLFSFNSTSGNSVASTNTTLGTVIMATEYDPTKPAFANKQAMENYHFSTSCKPSENMLHAIECKKTLSPVKQLYIRVGNNTGTDLRWTDFGNFYIATVGCPGAGTVLGELWATYKIKLIKPRLPTTVGLGGQIASGHAYRTGATTAAPLGTSTTLSSGTLALTFSNTTVSWIATPNMNYLISVYIAAGTSVTGMIATSSVGVTGVNIFQNDSAGVFSTGTTTSGQTVTNYVTCTNTSPGLLCSLTYTATIVGAATLDVLVQQLDKTVVT